MPRFIAFHPALFSCWNKIYSFAAAEASPGGFQERPLTNRTPPPLVNQALSGARHRRQHAGAKTSIFQQNRPIKAAQRGPAKPNLTQMAQI
jgi:hypothetical protein